MHMTRHDCGWTCPKKQSNYLEIWIWCFYVARGTGPIALWVWRSLQSLSKTLTTVCGGSTPPWSVFMYSLFRSHMRLHVFTLQKPYAMSLCHRFSQHFQSWVGRQQDRLVFFIIETLFAVTFFSEVIVRCAAIPVQFQCSSCAVLLPWMVEVGLATPTGCW